jgi:methylated-DNA-[protein]-cysteine S-methyltransferase
MTSPTEESGERFHLPGTKAQRAFLETSFLDGASLVWGMRRVPSWGDLFLAVTQGGICRIHLAPKIDPAAVLARLRPTLPPSFLASAQAPPELAPRDDRFLAPFLDQIDEFLVDPGRSLVTLPVDAAGTDFQRRVWQALWAIPAGQVASYGEMAERLGRKGAARAVGAACGANPVPFVVPCHRVVAADGMGGFSLEADYKERLLAAERGQAQLPM